MVRKVSYGCCNLSPENACLGPKKCLQTICCSLKIPKGLEREGERVRESERGKVPLYALV